MLPEPIQNCINAFSRLPGVGPKTAARLTFFLLRDREGDLARKLAYALEELISGTDTCPTCFNLMASSGDQCEICASPERDRGVICVVEEPLDLAALERTSGFPGLYHVLG